MQFLVTTKLNENMLSAEIIVNDKRLNDYFYFYLILNGTIEDRVEWRKDNNYVWKLTKRGTYTVQGHLKRDGVNQHKVSKPEFFLLNHDKEAFNSFTKKTIDEVSFDIGFYKKKYPYQDFAVIVKDTERGGENTSDKINSSGLFLCNRVRDFNKKSIFMVTTEDKPNAGFFFSGTAKAENRLIFGDEDLDSEGDVDEIIESIGNYSLVKFDLDSVSIRTDYFGVSKVYYYSGNDTFIVSNSYHMLILLMKELNQKLTFNKPKILANLTFISLQPFYQNFSREMEVDDVVCMLPSQYILIDKSGVHFRETEIVKAFDVAEDINLNEYPQLLHEAKEEIVNNVRIVLKHTKFNHVILDLSGGLDARMVYSAVTNIPDAKKKIKINSLDLPNVPEDIKPALAINNNYNFEYDDLPEETQLLSPEKIVNSIYSNYLGTYYSYMLPQERKKIEKTIRLNGMYGEVMARPYYSRRYLHTEIDADSIDDFVELYIEKYRGMALLGSSEKAISATKKIFHQELSILPGKSPIETFDLHYLFYRGSLHCNDTWRTDISVPEWGPLQSKKLFLLKMKTFNKFKSMKLQLDMMNVLNPIIAPIKYGDLSYNIEKESLKEELFFTSSIYKDLNLTENYSNDSWLEARKRKQENSLLQIESEEYYLKCKEGHSKIDLYDISNNALAYVFEKGILDYDEAIIIYCWILQNKYERRLQYLSNKLVSLAIQVRLVTSNH